MNKKIIYAFALCATATSFYSCKDDSEDDLNVPSGVKGIYINEVCSSGNDWVEFYNSTDKEVSLAGFHLQDSKGAEEEYTISSDTKIPAKGFLVLEKGSSFEFGIGSGGDEIKLLDDNYSIIDDVIVPKLADGETYSRKTDGVGDWTVVANGTKGRSNGSAVPSSSLVGKLFVNEVYTFSDQKDINDLDYIELYNASSETVEVGGLKLWEGGGQAEAWTIPSGKSISPKGFLVIECDKENLHNDPTNYPSWGLSKNEETIVLADDKFSVIDEVKTPSLSTGETYGRKTDGAKEWVIFVELTKGKSNDGAKEKQTIVNTYGIYVNEVFTNNQKGEPTLNWDETKDFIELYNSTDKDFDLSGFSMLDDKMEEGDRFTFKSGTVIKAKSFLTVNVEKNNTDGPSFGLGKGGDKVFLFDKDKKTVDEVVTPKFADGEIYSYGRKSDGAAELVVFVEVSKNASNNGKKTK